VIGTTLGHYRIVDKIGEGGMGEVYRAHDERLDRDVAIKVLPEAVAADQDRLRRFEQEARAASALNHPNIVTIHDIGESAGTPYIAMEFVEGETLSALLAEGALPAGQLVRLATQIAEGLAKAHEAGIVHRDLKPENLMVTGDGYVKILDFGLAKLRTQPSETESEVPTETREGTVLGTVGYMSPEQAKGHSADFRSDQFSLGSILYEMASGRCVFRRETAVQTLSAIIDDTPQPLHRVRPKLPTQLCVIVDRCLAKLPEERYDSTRDLATELRGLREGLPTRRLQREAALEKPIDSLVVLPLVDLRPEPGEEYFADGMTETLITDLAKIGALKVISRTSAMQYRGTDKTPPQIAEELNVDAVVEGTVLRAGDRVRITAQLIDATTDQHMWAESYDRDFGDVLSMQSEVARSIAQQIEIRLSSQEEILLSRADRVNPEAHEAYLKGRHALNRFSEEGYKRGIQYFSNAIEEDPNFAPAYAGLADCYCYLGFIESAPPLEIYPKAKDAVLKALELDNLLAEAHTSLGQIRFMYDWDWSSAKREFQRAIELNHNSATSHLFYAVYLTNLGWVNEAFPEIRRALELDPLSVAASQFLGHSYVVARRYDEAMSQLQKTIELDPNFPLAHSSLGLALLQKGLHDEAIGSFQKALNAAGGTPIFNAYLALAFAKSGKRGTVFQELQALSKERYISSVYFALVCLALGETDQTFEWLEKAYDERATELTWTPSAPFFDPIRDDPRFQDILRRMNFPED
jgi:serine/threonine-protein kinase